MAKRKITIIEEEIDDKKLGNGTIDWTHHDTLTYDGFKRGYYNPCENCSNNPANNPNASGVCNCVLPYLYNGPFYSSGWGTGDLSKVKYKYTTTTCSI